jgi:cytochrome P450
MDVQFVLAGTSADTGRLSSVFGIGNHFAMMEAQLILATLIQRVTFELVPGQTIVPEPLITLRPKGGVRVVVQRWQP